METPDSIHDFWFGSHANDAELAQQRSKLWWSKSTETDQQIRTRFAGYVKAVAAHDFDNWASSVRGWLSLILLTDQFPRHIYRDTPKAFETDALAQTWCLTGIEQGIDKKLRPIERVFFYLPMEHSESMEHQRMSVQLFTRLYQEVPLEAMDTFRIFLIYALRHRRIVERFGRFPHRNAILGRESTQDEEAFLQEPGSSF